METYITHCTGTASFMLSPLYENIFAALSRDVENIPAEIIDQPTAIAATALVAKINGFAKECEAEHKRLKAPYLKASRELDGVKKQIVGHFDAFKQVLNDRIVAYQKAEQEKARKAAEEAAKEAARIAAEAAEARAALPEDSQQAHAAATDIVAAQAASNIIAAANAAPVAGMAITRSVAIKSVNIAVLAATRVDLCKIEADLPKIKAEILAGKTIPGVEASIVEMARVRAAKVNTDDFNY